MSAAIAPTPEEDPEPDRDGTYSSPSPRGRARSELRASRPHPEPLRSDQRDHEHPASVREQSDRGVDEVDARPASRATRRYATAIRRRVDDHVGQPFRPGVDHRERQEDPAERREEYGQPRVVVPNRDPDEEGRHASSVKGYAGEIRSPQLRHRPRRRTTRSPDVVDRPDLGAAGGHRERGGRGTPRRHPMDHDGQEAPEDEARSSARTSRPHPRLLVPTEESLPQRLLHPTPNPRIRSIAVVRDVEAVLDVHGASVQAPSPLLFWPPVFLNDILPGVYSMTRSVVRVARVTVVERDGFCA